MKFMEQYCDNIDLTWKQLKTTRHSVRGRCPNNRPGNGFIQSNYGLPWHVQTLGIPPGKPWLRVGYYQASQVASGWNHPFRRK